MTKQRYLRGAVLCALCALAFGSVALGADKGELQELFKRAQAAFETDRYDEAAALLEKILEARPHAADLLELRDMADARFYVQALTKGSAPVQEKVRKLLELAAQAEKERLTDPAQIEKLVAQLSASFEERAAVYIQLVSAGRYAVPPLVDRLVKTKAADYAEFHVPVTVALVRIGEEAVVPLCTALRASEPGVRQDIAFVLGRIGDPRAIPHLLRLAKSDPDETVRAVAAGSLARIGEYVEIPDEPPHLALCRHAKLYYYGDPSVDRPGKYGETIWTWSARDSRLVLQPIPGFLYNVSMARNVVMEALLSNPEYEPVMPFLISCYHREALTIERRFELSKTDAEARLTEPEEQQLRARLSKCRNVLLTLRSAGEKHFYHALMLQLRDGEHQLAAAIIEDLALTASPELRPWPAPVELLAPARPAVVDIDRSLARLTAPGAEPAAAPAATATTPGVTVRPKVDPMKLFGVLVGAEEKRLEAAAPKVARTVAGAPPAERELLNQILAMRRRAVERRETAAARVESEAEKTAELNPLVMALRSPDKGVRYGAAAALARIGPLHDFPGSKAVVEILGQAITERGVSTVLIISTDAQSANALSALLRGAGYAPYTAGSTETALSAARSLPPKDLILLASDMKDTFDTLKKDPAVAGVPVIVFSKDEDIATVQQLYAGQVASVVSLKAEADKLKAEVTRVILGQRTLAEGMKLSGQYARIGAMALNSIPRAGSPFSVHLASIKDALVGALDSESPEVRISATRLLGRARIQALMPRLIDMCESKDRAQAEQLACVEAIGNMMDAGQPVPKEVAELLERIHATGSAELRLFAVQHLAPASLPAGRVEKLVTEQEAAGEAPVAPPPPAP